MGQLRKINNNTSGRLRKISNNTQNSNINFVPTGNPTLKQSGNLSQGGGSLLYSESGSGSLFKKKKDNISTLDSVLTTIGDAALESTQATLGLVENLVSDPLTRLTGAVVGIFNKDLSKQIKDYADNDIVGSMFGKSDDLNIGLISKESRKMIDEYSLLGDVGDAVSQGVGTSLGLGAAGSVISGVESGVIGSAATSKGVQAANTFATSGISSYNSKLSEMHKAGYDEHNSQIAALKEGIFEGITENIGAGIPGLNTSGAFEGLEKSLGNAITKSLNKTAGKIAVNVLKAGEESSEEFFNNLFNEVSDRILYQIDKNYTYGKDEKSDSLIKDIFNEKTLEAMVSAGISSALTMGGSNVFDKVSTNKAIKSYAKDNNISFKEARDTINKYKQTISENLQRNGEESIVEANQQASAIALRSAKDGSIAYNENRLKNLLKVTNDTEENIRKDLVSGRYDRYTFKKGTNANENALEMSFRDAGADNSQRTKDLVDLGKSIQNATKNKVQVRATNREQLLQNNNVLNSINKDIRKSQQELIKEEQQEINRINNEYEAQLNSIDSTGMLDETLEASIRLEQQEKIQDIRQEYTRRLSEVKDKIQNEFLNNLNGFMTKDENGNAVLVVNYDSTNTESGKFIIGHELTHTLENVEGYEEYKKLINEYYQKNNSEEYNNHKKQLEKLYANNKGDIEAEMTADLTGKMFSDEKFLTNMLNTKANMFTNIYSKVKELYYKATGQQEKAQLEEIMRNFRNVYAKVKNADIDKEVKLSLSEDNQGNEVAPGMQKYMSDSRARVDEDINKPLVKVYHTTTNEIAQFNEFNPVGTEGYRFGDQVVNYYTDSKDMSGSYADSEYEMADTKRVENINEAKDLISGYNAENETSFEIVNNSDGTMSIVDNTYANALSRMRELWENEFSPEEKARLKEYGEQMEGYIKSGYDNNLYPDFGSLDKVLPDISKKIDNIESNLKSYERDIFSSIRTNPDGEIPSYIQTEPVYVGTYNTENELLRDVKSALKRANSVRAKYQYEGYVNITNPYVIDAEGRNWNAVETKENEFTNKIKDLSNESKELLKTLSKDSEKVFRQTEDNYLNLDKTIGDIKRNDTLPKDITGMAYVIQDYYSTLNDFLENQYLSSSSPNMMTVLSSLRNNGLITLDEYADYSYDGTKSNELRSKINDIINKEFEFEGSKYTLKELSNDWHNAMAEYYQKYNHEWDYFYEEANKRIKELNEKDYKILDDLFIEANNGIRKMYLVAKDNFNISKINSIFGDNYTTNDIVKRVIDLNKNGYNYDGVIIKNTRDYGGEYKGKHTANNLYVTFNSNQFKAVDNENPTDDPDIRYSMSEEQETTPNEDAIRNQIVKEMPELPFVEDTDKGIENNNITPYTNSKGGILSDEDIKTRANELINEKINRNTLRTNERALEEAKISLNLDKQKVDEFNNSLNQYRGMTSEQLSQSKARDDIYDFVQKNSTMTYKENFEDETLKKAKNELRKTKIKITDELKNSITDYNEFKKSVFGKLTLSNEGQGVDSVYNEFKEMYPSYFEELNTEEDMLYKLKDFMESNTNTINEETYELTPNEIKSFADRIYYALQRGRLSESELNKYVSEINSKMENVYNRRLAINKYREDAKQYTKNLDLIKDKKMGILYQINTAKRNIRDIMPKDMAEEWYNHYIKPVSDNNAKANITHQYYNDRIAKYNLNDEESTYVQMIGEKGHNPQTTLTDNQIIDFYNKNQNKIDKAKCEKAVEEFRSIYDELYNSINQVLRANGYKGLEYRKGYFPHFIEEKSTSFLGKLAEKMGWKKPSGALPTDIAGITEEFKPGKAWTSFTQQRTGDATDYNALKGFDNYLNGAMDVIFHTEDIQKLRALENEIRYQYSDKGVKEKIDSIMNDDSLDIEEKYEQIQSTLSNVRNNPLGNLVSEIREYTNNLANKKSFSDRSMEQLFGRNTYSISKQIMSRVSANMVGANVSSAMTNFIPITQAWGGMSTKNLFKGIQSTIQATFKDDGFSNNSVWLTNRTKQADRLYKSKLDKINEKLGIPFEAVDSFTSNVIVRGKYLDNIEKGMSEQEAISNADEFAKDVMAGRSKGETPTAFNKTNPLLKMFTAFQLEVNNQYGYMFKDLPASAGEAKDKLAAALLKVFLGAFLYNWLSEKITGRKSAFSPIDTAIDNIETATNENLDFGQKLQAITKDVSQELPFVSGIVGGGRLPISSAIPFANRSEYQDSALELMVEAFGEDEAKKAKAQKELIKEFSKPIYFLALPFAGGQIKKTIEGAEMYSHELPGSYTTSGNLRFEAPQDALGKAQALVFGQYASENAREYFDKGYSALTPKQVQEAQNADLSINEYREYQKGIKGKTKISEQVDYINSLPYSEEQKESLIKDKTKKDIDVSNYNNYDSYDEFNYAMNNPAKYDIIKQIVDYRTYNTYNDNIKKIKANSNNAKKEVINYIEKLNLNKYQKTMLYRISGGYSIKNYKNEMYNYINSLNITANEKKNIWKELYGG